MEDLFDHELSLLDQAITMLNTLEKTLQGMKFTEHHIKYRGVTIGVKFRVIETPNSHSTTEIQDFEYLVDQLIKLNQEYIKEKFAYNFDRAIQIENDEIPKMKIRIMQKFINNMKT